MRNSAGKVYVVLECTSDLAGRGSVARSLTIDVHQAGAMSDEAF